MSNYSSRSTKKLANSDIVDTYTSTSSSLNDTMTVGFRNSTSDYVIGQGTDL